MLSYSKSKRLLGIIIICLLPYTVNGQTHNHQTMVELNADDSCIGIEIICAKTVTSAFAPNGDLWRLWSHKHALYFDISIDNGLRFTQAQQVKNIDEDISSRNENRPKIAFDNDQGVYLSWATPREKKYTADVRFSYSADYGKSFTKAVTVNNDNLLTGHSFNEMLVSPNGDINLVWLDSRLAYQLRQQGKEANGSALYVAQANYRKNQKVFTNKMLANGTCVCCRIAMDYNSQGQLALFWRHIYGDNIREFALLTLDTTARQMPTINQVSHDFWQINGCPHQGGGLSIDQNNRYHMVWFNQGELGKGIFYAYSDNQGKVISKPLSVGQQKNQAVHPHVSQSNEFVDIVWLEFTGKEHQLWHQRSTDSGLSFSAAKLLAKSKNSADRPFIIKNKNQHFVSWQRPSEGHWLQAL